MINDEKRTLAVEEVDAAARYLIDVAKKHGAHVAGFVFGPDPVIIFNFGTCNDMSDPKLFNLLCELIAESKQDGTITIRDASGRKN